MDSTCISPKEGFTVALYNGDMMPRLISQVRRGLDCNCVCMGCGERLVAVHSDKVADYFRHHSPAGHEFTGCPESARNAESISHYLVKHHIAKVKRLKVRRLVITKEGDSDGFMYKPYIVYESKQLQFGDVILEKKQGNIIPDCVGVINGRRLLIEVKVTHGIDDIKLAKIIEMNASVVEVFVQERVSGPDDKYLDKLVTNQDYTEWVHSPITKKSEPAANRYFEQQRKEYDKELEDIRIAAQLKKAIKLKAARPGNIQKILDRETEVWDQENLGHKAFHASVYWDEGQATEKCRLALLELGAPICKEIDIKASEILNRLEQVETTIQTHRSTLKELTLVLPIEYRNVVQNQIPSSWSIICTRYYLGQEKVRIFNIWQSCMADEEEDVIKPSLRHKSKTMGTYEVSAESHYNRMLTEWRSKNVGTNAFELSGIWDSQKEQIIIESEFKDKYDSLINAACDTHQKLTIEILELSNRRTKIEEEIDGLWDYFSDSMKVHFKEPLAKLNLIGRHANPSEWLDTLQVKYLYQHKSNEYDKWNTRQQEVRSQAWNFLLYTLQSRNDEEVSLRASEN